MTIFSVNEWLSVLVLFNKGAFTTLKRSHPIKSISAPLPTLSQNCLSWRTVLLEETQPAGSRAKELLPIVCLNEVMLEALGAISDPKNLRRSRIQKIKSSFHDSFRYMGTKTQHLCKAEAFIFLGISLPFTFSWAVFWEQLGPIYLQCMSFAIFSVWQPPQTFIWGITFTGFVAEILAAQTSFLFPLEELEE